MTKTKRDFASALKIFLSITLVTGVVYTFSLLGVSQLCFSNQANGSFKETGYGPMSLAAGQMDYRADHLWGRPVSYQTMEKDGKVYVYASPANDGYGSQETKQKQEKLRTWIEENSFAGNKPVPAELYVSSASGMDPQISLEAADYQIDRLIETTGIDQTTLEKIFQDHSSSLLSSGPQEKTVNVAAVNLAIDELIHSAS